MKYEQEILTYLYKNSGATSNQIMDHLNKVKVDLWTKSGGWRAWLVRRNSIWVEANMGRLYVALERLKEADRISSTKEGDRFRYYFNYETSGSANNTPRDLDGR